MGVWVYNFCLTFVGFSFSFFAHLACYTSVTSIVTEVTFGCAALDQGQVWGYRYHSEALLHLLQAASCTNYSRLSPPVLSSIIPLPFAAPFYCFHFSFLFISIGLLFFIFFCIMAFSAERSSCQISAGIVSLVGIPETGILAPLAPLAPFLGPFGPNFFKVLRFEREAPSEFEHNFGPLWASVLRAPPPLLVAPRDPSQGPATPGPYEPSGGRWSRAALPQAKGRRGLPPK